MSDLRRRVHMTKHAFSQARAKFPEIDRLAHQDYDKFVRSLVAAAGSSEESTVKSVCLGNIYTEGTLFLSKGDSSPIVFVMKPSDTPELWDVVTVLTKEELYGNGASHVPGGALERGARQIVEDLRHGNHGQSEKRYLGDLLADIIESHDDIVNEETLEGVISSLDMLIEVANEARNDLKLLILEGHVGTEDDGQPN